MPLTQAQKTTLKAHLAANTNTVVNVANGQAVAVNACPDTGDNYQHVADWYNSAALAGDSQPIAAPLTVWRPAVTITDLNRAIDWTAQPAGADAPSQTVSWLKWQSMCWSNVIDLTDPQVRQGVVTVWGNPSTTATAVGATGVGRQVGTRLECLLASNGVGGAIGLGAAARVSQVFGYRITEGEIRDALLNG